MSLSKVDICGVKIDNLNTAEALAEIERLTKGPNPVFVVTPNVDHIVTFQEDEEFKRAYENATLVLPDGMPVVWASHWLGTPLKEKVSGSDLLPLLCERSTATGLKLFFLGGAEGVVQKTAEIFHKQYPGIRIAGTYTPPFGFSRDEEENRKAVEAVRAARPDILLVGLGTPKQEKWIARFKDQLAVPVSIGIGASFDFVVGVQKRAPLWMRDAGLEWLWRTLCDPRRMAGRYLHDLVFFSHLYRQCRRRRSRPVERVLDVRYDNLSQEDSLSRASELLRPGSRANIFFLNFDCLRVAHHDSDYRDILEHSDLVLPDGVGLRLATRIFGGHMRENLNGTDWTPVFLRSLEARAPRVFFLGGKPGVAERARGVLAKKIPYLAAGVCRDGYFKIDQEVIEMINASGADIVLVGMGAPLQEKWIARNRAAIKAPVCIAVGGLFDWVSGRMPRAPRIFRMLQLEWFWRILIDPKRMVKRYLVHGLSFFLYIVRCRITGHTNSRGKDAS